MVAPLKSYSRSVNFTRLVTLPHGSQIRITDLAIYREGYTQQPPFNIDTPYEVTVYIQRAGITNNFLGSASAQRDLQIAINVARARLVAKLGDSSSFGATATAERKATWGTVVGAITSALLAARAVKSGKFGKAAEILGFHPPTKITTVRRKYRKSKSGVRRKTTVVKRESWVMPGGRELSKGAANKWLWYSYGVKPLVGDIYNGMDVLTRDFPWSTFRGAGSASSENTQNVNTTVKSSSSVRMRIDVRVANPNLWLANQLGLINPVQWINEGIPFSFVIDWFSNLSQIIMQMTDFVGLETAKPITTSKSYIIQHVPDVYFGPSSSETQSFLRGAGIPNAKLRFSYERFQWQRGANAISLLVGLLKNNRPKR